jgi:hypothetical protein
MLIIFAELITLLLKNIILEDYLIKHKSLTKKINKSGIKLMSEKQSLLVIIMEFNKLSSYKAIIEV